MNDRPFSLTHGEHMASKQAKCISCSQMATTEIASTVWLQLRSGVTSLDDLDVSLADRVILEGALLGVFIYCEPCSTAIGEPPRTAIMSFPSSMRDLTFDDRRIEY